MVRIRQHVNPLKLANLVPRARRLELPEGRDLELELGCADAQFLFERAAVVPDAAFYGVEIRRELVELVNRRAARESVPVSAIFANANVDLPALFPPASIAGLYVNFPDPWFKRRHHKRRVIEPGLVGAIVRILRPGGTLFFQSDVFDLALDALASFEDSEGLVNRAGPWSFWKDGNPYGVRSRREQGCEAQGTPIWRILYERAAR